MGANRDLHVAPSGDAFACGASRAPACRMSTYLRRRFDADPTSVGRARAFVREALGARVPDHDLTDLTWAVSELATNAVVHAGTAFEIVLELDGVARVEVEDRSVAIPRERKDRIGGIHIIGRVCDRWGVHLIDGRKCVWCERDLG